VASGTTKFDDVGRWSEIKLEIIGQHAKAYSTILAAQGNLRHVYIDAFAGAGEHVSRETGDVIEGSPKVALAVTPPFDQYHFIDLDGSRAANLQKLVGSRTDVHVHEGDCNEVLLEQVFPRCRYEDYRRALCILDPYGLHLDWKVLVEAGRMRSVEIFLNFPMMDMNRNVLLTDPSKLSAEQAARMTRFWGDESWRDAAYVPVPTLFGETEHDKVRGNKAIVDAFRRRLREVASFPHVPEPLAMTNSTNSTLYYLFFASHNATGAKIARDIFKRHA
jgi:three-Cys-motif partner protein